MSSSNLNNILRAIIVDDELHGRENLKNIFEKYFTEVEVLGLADSVTGAKRLVMQYSPDVVFLDINMPVLDGFDFLDEFENRNFMVVFVSAHSEYGINAVKAGAVDYLLKPVSIKELKQTIKKLLQIQNKKIKEAPFFEKDKLVIPAVHGFNVIIIDDIIRLEAAGSYTSVFLASGKNILVSRTLKDFEDAIPKEKFFRIHKSHIISLKYLKEFSNIDGGFVIMADGSKVEISRRKTPEFILKIKSAINA